MIRVSGLTRRYHDLVAVDDVSFDVEEGEVFGFLGPNGAGKSTTIKILTGFLPATSGRAEVGGYDVARDSLAVRKQLGYLAENAPVPADARVDEYLEFRARLKGLPARSRESAKAKVLGQCGLEPMRRRILGQLSRGYRQRVGLADALLGDPPVLVLDEPTGGLDPAQRQDVLDMVSAMKGHKTVVLSSHVLAEVDGVCSRVGIIKNGKLMAVGTRAELEETVGRRGEVRVAVRGDNEALITRLRDDGLQAVRPDGEQAAVAQLGDRDPAALLAELVGAGLPVVSFEPLTRSLQQIFLDVTRS